MNDIEATRETAGSRVLQLGGSMAATVEAVRRGAHERVRDFDATRLGVGLRLCQAYFGFVMAVMLAYAFVIPPSAFAYDTSLAYALGQMVVAALSLWLVQVRSRAARPFAIAGTVVCCAFWAVDLFAFGALDVLVQRVGPAVAFPVLVAQYASSLAVVAFLAFSARAQVRLAVPFSRDQTLARGHSWDIPLRQRVRTWPFWRDLLILFIVFSFLGHWAEMWFCYHIYLGVFMGDYDFSQAMLWSQWLFPYTAEGVAIIAIALILHPVKEALLKRTGGRVLPALLGSIAVTALVCTTIDFTCGMIANQDYSLWDYRALPFNFMGQICLQNSTVYTVAATLIVWVFYPLMDRALQRMPRMAADGLLVGLSAVYAFCALLHFLYLTPTGLVIGV